MEDLCQIGSIGLLKAIDKFDPSFEVCFCDVCGSDDCGGDPAVSAVGGDGEGEPPDPGTGVESVCGAGAAGAGERARSDAGGDSGELDVTVEEIVEAMESGAEVESLQKTIYQGENHDISLMDRIPEKENGQEKLLNRIFLEELLGRLPAKERQLIYMRYFQDMTQAQIAGKLGISQVQVSRMEKKILRQMRMEKV